MVDNVQGAQRELMKYWSRVSGNRWLVAKMFGVLMVFHASQISTTSEMLIVSTDLLPPLGSYCRLNKLRKLQQHKRWRPGMHCLMASIGRKWFV